MKRLVLACLLFVVPIDTGGQNQFACCTFDKPTASVSASGILYLTPEDSKEYCEISKVNGKWTPHPGISMEDCVAAGILTLPIPHYEEWFAQHPNRPLRRVLERT